MNVHYLLQDHALGDYLLRAKSQSERSRWSKRGRLEPPDGVKQAMVLDHAQRFQIDTLVEIGTYLGDTIYAVKDGSKDIYPIIRSS